MSEEVTTTLLIFLSFFACILSGKVAVDLALAGAMVLLVVTEVVTPSEALSGFSNPALFIIACFYIVSAAVRESGALNSLVMKWLGSKAPLPMIMPRLMAPVAFASSIMSNTPVVAMLIPYLREWSKRNRVGLSKLLIPLSFASILGGVCTLIGTSTNIIVVGLLESKGQLGDLSIFSPAIIGLPIICLGILYFSILGHRLLPNKNIDENWEDYHKVKKYAVNMKIEANGALVGKTVSASGLMNLSYSLLSEIRSNHKVFRSVRGNRILRAGDILVFVGQPDTITELRQISGLATVGDQLSKIEAPKNSRALVEAILATQSSLIGKTLKKIKF